MTADIPNIEPKCIIAGDTVTWKRSFCNYPASEGWTLTYYIKGIAALTNVVASASGNEFLVTISAATTGAYTAGDYWWQAKVSKAGEVHTVDQSSLEIKTNLSGASAGYSGKSHAEKVLEALNAMIEGKASLDQQSYSIAGRSISRMSPQEIIDWRNEYRGIVAAEKKAEGNRRGTGKSNKVLIRL